MNIHEACPEVEMEAVQKKAVRQRFKGNAVVEREQELRAKIDSIIVDFVGE